MNNWKMLIYILKINNNRSQYNMIFHCCGFLRIYKIVLEIHNNLTFPIYNNLKISWKDETKYKRYRIKHIKCTYWLSLLYFVSYFEGVLSKLIKMRNASASFSLEICYADILLNFSNTFKLQFSEIIKYCLLNVCTVYVPVRAKFFHNYSNKKKKTN